MAQNVKSLIRRAPRVSTRFSGFRRCSRKKMTFSVVVRDESGLEVPLESLDLSQTGIFLKSSILFDVGQQHTLEFVDRYGHRVKVKAEVVRVAGDSSTLRRTPKKSVAGMGYEFLDTDERTRSQLLSLIGLD